MTNELTLYPDRLEVQTRETYFFVMWSLGALLGLGALAYGVWFSDLLTSLIGSLFLVVCTLGASGASYKTVVLRKAGPCELVRRRILGGKTTTRTFSRADIRQINYVQGFNEETFRWWTSRPRDCEVMLELHNGEQIRALMRLRILNQTTMPPTEEARQISDYLQVPLNTVDIHTFRRGVKNFDQAIKVGERPAKKP